MKKDNDPLLFSTYQAMLTKYGEPKRVAYNMRMDQIIEEVKESPDHIFLKSNSSESGEDN